jgi:hypothetical protein
LAAELEDRLEQVPGLGAVGIGHLKAAGIQTPHQLIGKFLSFKTKVGASSVRLLLSHVAVVV